MWFELNQLLDFRTYVDNCKLYSNFHNIMHKLWMLLLYSIWLLLRQCAWWRMREVPHTLCDWKEEWTFCFPQDRFDVYPISVSVKLLLAQSHWKLIWTFIRNSLLDYCNVCRKLPWQYCDTLISYFALDDRALLSRDINCQIDWVHCLVNDKHQPSYNPGFVIIYNQEELWD